MFNKFILYMPKLLKGKAILTLFILVSLLIMTAVWGFGKTVIAYQEADEIKTKLVEMQVYIDDWNKQESIVNEAKFRPINASQVEDVQSKILLLLSAQDVNLTNFRDVVNNKKNNTERVYEIVFLGNWESTINILEQFHVDNALIAIQKLKLESEKDNLIKTSLTYKIYTK